GVERHVEELAFRLIKLGHQVTVYTRSHYTNPQKKKYRGINLVNIKTIPTKHLDAICHTFFCSLDAIRQDYDIIHYHAVGPSLMSFIPRIFKPKTKVVVTFHCIDRKHQKWNKFAQTMLRIGEWTAVNFPHITICVSKTLKKYVRRVYSKSAVYIPNGVSEPKKAGTAADIKKRFGLEKNNYLLVVTRLVRHKGVHHLIKAFKKSNTKMKLAIVGGSFFTDEYFAYLRKLAEGDNRIVFTGFQSGKMLKQLFSNAYLFIHPSEAEGLPISVLEAGSFGQCILCSDIPENKEIIKQKIGDIGFTFRNKSVRDLGRKLEYLLANPGVVNGKKTIAKQTILREFNWNEIARKTSMLYQEICEDTGDLFLEKVKAIN
ncbi:glycosyltransferase family 4 protein, partial [Patescibacteria group bacterium]|nr:glycosyltransferase family 4 protein [Patescibacteria group bacterium]